MTSTLTTPTAAAGGASTWGLSWQGVRTVAGLELRQRVRSTRWLVVLIVWFIALVLLTLLVKGAVNASVGDVDAFGVTQDRAEADAYAAASVFGIVVFLVLALGGLVAPALSATSINGDRSAGVLAALQTTLLTPAEIVIGKLLAAWLTAMALLAAALPVLVWAYLGGGTPVTRLLTTLAVLALSLLVVCAVALGWSAVAARMSSSTVLTYLTVLFLGLGLPILFGLSAPLVQEETTRQVRVFEPTLDAEGNPTDTGSCVTRTETRTEFRSDRTWWLLAANPFVVVADSAPPVRTRGMYGIGDPLTGIRDGVRTLRLGSEAITDQCGTTEQEYQEQEQQRQAEADRLPAIWPYGLAADLALGAVFTVIAIRRLRAPARTLPRGTRVA